MFISVVSFCVYQVFFNLLMLNKDLHETAVSYKLCVCTVNFIGVSLKPVQLFWEQSRMLFTSVNIQLVTRDHWSLYYFELIFINHFISALWFTTRYVCFVGLRPDR